MLRKALKARSANILKRKEGGKLSAKRAETGAIKMVPRVRVLLPKAANECDSWDPHSGKREQTVR